VLWKNFLKQLEETVSFLGDYINLYQIHSATFESGVLENVNIHKALHQTRTERGWAIGLSVSSPKQDQVIRQAMKLQVEGNSLFNSVQCTYNVLEQSPGAVLLEAHQAGLDVIIKEGLANGRVLQNPVIQEYSQRLKCEPDQLALACVLAQPFQPRVLSGAVTPEQLESNWMAEKVAQVLRDDLALLAEIMEKTKMDSEQYWSDRAYLSWN
jgi:aryl-alcohol dehydrogenase-like predicted oxidoreductase